MRIAIIGPGVAPIPPTGWGAVEILVHGLRCALEDEGHEVCVVNVPEKAGIIKQTNLFVPDFVHIHYENHIDVAPHITCEHIAATAHNAYLDQPERWVNDSSYSQIIHKFASTGVDVFALSQPAADAFLFAGVEPKKIKIVYNGTSGENFRFSENCEYPDMSLYLAKIDFRKRQHLFQGIPGLFFAGNIADDRFDQSVNYLGEWSKSELHENLTKFANLVLLSDGECHSLALLEGMSAGLGLVISEFACSNLDLDKPFIDVVPESKIHDKEYIAQVIKKNAETSIKMRADIKEYSKKFLWKNVVRDVYLPAVKETITKNKSWKFIRQTSFEEQNFVQSYVYKDNVFIIYPKSGCTKAGQIFSRLGISRAKSREEIENANKCILVCRNQLERLVSAYFHKMCTERSPEDMKTIENVFGKRCSFEEFTDRIFSNEMFDAHVANFSDLHEFTSMIDIDSLRSHFETVEVYEMKDLPLAIKSFGVTDPIATEELSRKTDHTIEYLDRQRSKELANNHGVPGWTRGTSYWTGRPKPRYVDMYSEEMIQRARQYFAKDAGSEVIGKVVFQWEADCNED